MPKLLTVILLLLATTLTAGEQPAPNLGGILSLFGRFSFAHGCPIAADRVLTNSHVLDIRPFDREMPLFPYRFQSNTEHGQIVGIEASAREDLAWAVPTPPLSFFYPLAAVAPEIGETLYWVGYDHRNRKNGLARKSLSGKVLRVVVGHIIFDTSTPHGSSGSCVLNSRGEVVGLIAWGLYMDNSEELAVAVGTWGDWLPAVVLDRKPAEQTAPVHSDPVEPPPSQN